MDAKQAVNFLRGEWPKIFVKNIGTDGVETLQEIADLIEHQEKHAELGRLVTEKIDQCNKNVIVCYAYRTCAVKELCYKHKDEINNNK